MCHKEETRYTGAMPSRGILLASEILVAGTFVGNLAALVVLLRYLQMQGWLRNWLRKRRLENSNIGARINSATKTRFNFVCYPMQNLASKPYLWVFFFRSPQTRYVPWQGGSAYRLDLCWRLKGAFWLADTALFMSPSQRRLEYSSSLSCKRNCPTRALYDIGDGICLHLAELAPHMGEQSTCWCCRIM